MSATDPLRRAAYAGMTAAGGWPWLVLPASRLVGHGVVLDDHTDVVVEGFPRSGSSLAVAVLRTSQDPPPVVAHHLHAPAHVLAAARRGVPTLVALRPPSEAVPELVRAKPFLRARAVLRAYLRFHEPLLPVRQGFAVVTWDELAADPSMVAGRLNEVFGTTFAISPVRDDLTEAIEGYWRSRRGPGLPLVGRTSADAVAAGSPLAPELDPDPDLLARAEALFRALTQAG